MHKTLIVANVKKTRQIRTNDMQWHSPNYNLHCLTLKEITCNVTVLIIIYTV